MAIKKVIAKVAPKKVAPKKEEKITICTNCNGSGLKCSVCGYEG